MKREKNNRLRKSTTRQRAAGRSGVPDNAVRTTPALLWVSGNFPGTAEGDAADGTAEQFNNDNVTKRTQRVCGYSAKGEKHLAKVCSTRGPRHAPNGGNAPAAEIPDGGTALQEQQAAACTNVQSQFPVEDKGPTGCTGRAGGSRRDVGGLDCLHPPLPFNFLGLLYEEWWGNPVDPGDVRVIEAEKEACQNGSRDGFWVPGLERWVSKERHYFPSQELEQLVLEYLAEQYRRAQGRQFEVAAEVAADSDADGC